MIVTSIRRPLWLDVATGAVECAHHSYALEVEAAADPFADELVTDLGVYSRVTAEDVVCWQALGQGEIRCESCGCQVALSDRRV